MTGDHPTDWASKYVKAAALRDAADSFRRGSSLDRWQPGHVANWLEDRADEIEQR
jgi:hypothetical protein